MLKRLHNLRNQLYERLMLFLGRHAPKTNEHLNDTPFVVAAVRGSANFCLYCLWTYMEWDDESEMWTCPKCGLSCHPPLAITEKRPALLPPPKVVHLDPNTGQPMRLSVAYKRKTIDLGKWIQDRPVWRDTGREVTTGELPRVRLDDRRTG